MSVENGMNAATFQRLIDEALPFAGDMEMEVSLYSLGRPDPVAHVTGTYALPPS